MTSAAKLAANIANAQLSTGPRSETGRATSSQNANKSGLFSNTDCIRPGEEPVYAELDDSLRADLAPQGQLEHHLVDEIRRAMWRLLRCGKIEAAMMETFVGTCASIPENPIPDPMQNEATAKLQLSVDRARSQCHRLFHKCTAELRKLQTERQIRNECLEAGADLTHLGLSDFRSVAKAVDEQARGELLQNQLDKDLSNAILKRSMRQATAVPMDLLPTIPSEIPVTKQTQTPRNARCTCGSGQKYKRCCGKSAPAMLHAA